MAFNLLCPYAVVLLSVHCVYMNLPDAATLGEVYDGDGSFYSRCTGSRDLLQWVVGLEQRRRRRLFVLKAEVAAQ